MELNNTNTAVAAPMPTASEIEQWLVTNIASLAEIPPEEVEIDIPITSFGLESLTLFSLAGDLASWLDHDISTRLLWEYPTIEAIAAHLSQSSEELEQEQTQKPAPRSLVAIQPDGDSPTLFLVHDLSGTIWCYRALSHHLGANQPVYGFELPISEDGETEVPRIEELAALYVDELRVFQPQGPYLLGGFSMGGTIAFEMAQQLRARGEEVALLVLMDAYFPGLTRKRQSLSHKLRIHLRHLIGLQGPQRWSYLRQRVYQIRYRLRQLQEKLQERIQKKPSAAAQSPEYLRQNLLRMQVVTSANQAFDGYRARPYDGPLTLLRARTQFYVAYDHRAWRRVTKGKFEQHFLPGEHGTIVSEPEVGQLAVLIQRCIRQAQDATKGG